jgi:uncharacterized protein
VERRAELRELVLGSAWLTNLLRLVAALDLPDCWIGAGAVRDLVWDIRFGPGFDPASIADVDVVFFDADDLSAKQEHAVERTLRKKEPSVEWDVKNQARVHLWYEARFGGRAAPLRSTTDGVATWPETATAVAVRLDGDGALEIAAPLGLDDLLDGIWRRNLGPSDTNRATEDEYQARIECKQPHVRWPAVTVLP